MIWILLFSIIAEAAEPTPFPVFLKQGFSSVLEFQSAPKKIVIGDSQSFQVEKMDQSLVIRALVPFATGNLFVFFSTGKPRVFLLTASEDAEPTLYRKFEETKVPAPAPKQSRKPSMTAGILIASSKFDEKKDFLTIDFTISSNSSRVIRPEWEKARLKFNGTAISPAKLWAERKEVQRDAKVRARFIFPKPNVPRSLAGTTLVIPLKGEQQALIKELRGN